MAALGLGVGNAQVLRNLGMTPKQLDEIFQFAVSSNPASWWPIASPLVGYAAADAASKVKPY
jgi:hypothetical protein